METEQPATPCSKLRVHQCLEKTTLGGLCGKTFARGWNLRRHISTQHGGAGGPGLTYVVHARVGEVPAGDTSVTGQPPNTPLAAAQSLTPPVPVVPVKRKRADSLDPHAKRVWLGRGRFQDEMPAYDVKLSKKFTGQQRAVGWLTAAAKNRLDTYIQEFLCRWGVTAGHHGSCVLWPRD